MAFYLGVKYKLSSSEKFDDYMKVLGVGLITRKMGNAMTPSVTLTRKDDVYTLTTMTTFKNTTITFKEGEEFTEETLDGRKVKTEIKFEGNKMIQNQKSEAGEHVSTIIREFSSNQMKTTLTAKDVTCVRIYEKAE